MVSTHSPPKRCFLHARIGVIAFRPTSSIKVNVKTASKPWIRTNSAEKICFRWGYHFLTFNWHWPFIWFFSLSQTKPLQVGWLLLAPENTDFSSCGLRKRVMMTLAFPEPLSIRYRPLICNYVLTLALIFLCHLCYRNGRGDILCFTSMGFWDTLWMRWWGFTCFSCSVS